jgi:hypothetical protein
MNALSFFQKSVTTIALVSASLCSSLAAGDGAGGAAGGATGGAAIKFISGGASVEDFTALNQQTSGYSLKLVFAAKGSGAYLADVEVTMMALPSREVVLDTRTEGPMLLAALPAGRYLVNAQYSDAALGAAARVSRTIVVPRAGLVSQMMYFNTADLVSAESPREYHTGR